MPPYRPDRIYGTMAPTRIEEPFPTCPEYAMCAWGFRVSYPHTSKMRINYQGVYWLKYINGLCRIHSTARP